MLSQALIETEAAGLIGAELHERSGERAASRNVVPTDLRYAGRHDRAGDSEVELIRFGGHLPKGGYDARTDGRHAPAPAAPALR